MGWRFCKTSEWKFDAEHQKYIHNFIIAVLDSYGSLGFKLEKSVAIGFNLHSPASRFDVLYTHPPPWPTTFPALALTVGIRRITAESFNMNEIQGNPGLLEQLIVL